MVIVVSNRKFLFLYLNTGAGHISAAKVLAQAMKEEDPSVEIEMKLGFKKNGISRVFFEKGYNYACNYFHGAFPLLYDLGEYRFVQSLLHFFVGTETRRYLRKLILKEHPTDIVCFHFGVTPFVKTVLKNIPWKINFTVIVTDPFTLPKAWFYERDVNYFVYSEDAKQVAVTKCGVPEKNVKVIPFLMNQKFAKQYPADKIRELKIKHGFNPDKKIVLLVGGGEGLPGASEIINQCILHHSNFSIAVICGKDKVKKANFEVLSKTYPKLDLHVYGFVDFLEELVKICDCAVIKAGPATLMEVLSCRKPVIICKYIHNQELGNMRFAVKHRVGWFIRRPKYIFKKINELLNDENFEENMKTRFDSISLDTDASKVAKLLFQK